MNGHVFAKPGAVVLSVSLALALLASFLVSPGLYNVDETIYVLGAGAIAQTGSFAVENGWQAYGSNDLRLWFLRPGPNGLVPQYPAGASLLAAPLLEHLGSRSFIVLNALASAVLVWLTYLTANLVFGARTAWLTIAILVFGTYIGEYALGVWPHAMSAAAVMAGFYLALRACAVSGSLAVFWGVASGLVISAGFLIRLDTVLILPVIAVVALFTAKDLFRVIFGGTLGLLVGGLAAAIINKQKFGTLNPLSYGTGLSGATDYSTHLIAAVCAVVGLALLILVRQAGTIWVPRLKLGAIFVAVVAVGSLFFHPGMRDLAEEVRVGIVSLGYDMTQSPDVRPGIVGTPGDVRLFWGLPKKSLVQSLPWLGLLSILFFYPGPQGQRKWLWIMVLAVAVWSLPFVPRAWHGGFGANMRYFLPVLPFLAILSAHALASVFSRAELSLRATRILAVCAVMSTLIFMYLRSDDIARLHQVDTRYLFWVLAALCLLTLVPREAGRSAARVAACVALIGIGTAAKVSWIDDFGKTQFIRSKSLATTQVVAKLEGPLLLYGAPEWYQMQLERPDALVAIHDNKTRSLDLDLIRSALGEGRRVFVASFLASQFPDDDETIFAEADLTARGGHRLVEVLSVGSVVR